MGGPVKENITLDLLDKIDIRVGTIRSVEDIAKSDKLVKLTVDSALKGKLETVK